MILQGSEGPGKERSSDGSKMVVPQRLSTTDTRPTTPGTLVRDLVSRVTPDVQIGVLPLWVPGSLSTTSSFPLHPSESPPDVPGPPHRQRSHL